MRPQLQIALDVGSICEAKQILTKEVLREVDIVEAGTLLLAAEGARAVKELRKHIGISKSPTEPGCWHRCFSTREPI